MTQDALKDLASRLNASASKRVDMVARFGFMPRSIIRDISRGKLSQKIYIYQREEPARREALQSGAKEKAAKLKALGRGSASHKGAGRGKPGASIMPAELVDFFIKYYAEPGQVYLDPFMGQGVRLQVAALNKLSYYGYDLSQEFYAYIKSFLPIVEMYNPSHTISATLGDSRTPDTIPNNIGDFCFTSPPYWDIEDYGPDPRQLGAPGTSYEDFLSGMYEVFRAWLPKFKSGAWVVLNVNDFRKDGKFYAYHADTINLVRSAGYILHDTWIIEGLVGGMPKAFSVDFNSKRIAPKIHEYALVFRKE